MSSVVPFSHPPNRRHSHPLRVLDTVVEIGIEQPEMMPECKVKMAYDKVTSGIPTDVASQTDQDKADLAEALRLWEHYQANKQTE